MRHLIFCLLSLVFILKSNAQGCVAIRSNGGTCTMMPNHDATNHDALSNWMVSVNSRYFKSYKHFVGREEQHERVDVGTEVINHFASTELGISRNLNNRWSFAFYVPVINNLRSSMYEHYGNSSKNPNARRTTKSFGIGDVRAAAYYWLLNPSKSSKLNVQLGLGIKLPTGDYRYQEYFYKNDSVKIPGPVDQSIQLGDGGTGITLEANSYYTFSKKLIAYVNAFYLSNPREQNGVSTTRGSAPSATAIAYGSDVMSVPDQYMVRAGANYVLNKFSFSGGMRMECVPAEDLI
ncbi:MAG: hypothetical protein ABR503_12635, partial [Chitinophagaceae bacterium]